MSRTAVARASAGIVALCAAGAVTLPAIAGAAPQGPHQISITAVPNPAQAGDQMVITGHFDAPDNANREVVLWRKFVPSRFGFRRVQTARTDASGNYVFSRADGVVKTNRDWKVTIGSSQSATARELVHALVNFRTTATQVRVNRFVTFFGHVTPGRRGERVVIQRQVGDAGNQWQTIRRSLLVTRGGAYRIRLRFRRPGTYTLRARFLGDRHNLGDVSDSLDVVVSDVQNRNLTLMPNAFRIPVGQAVALTGKLSAPNPGGHTITLFGHEAGQAFAPLATTTTKPDGGYSFTQAPPHTTVYQVRSDTGRRSAAIVEGVQDVVTAAADRASATSGDVVSFSGTVTPPHAGELIVLQHLGIDGVWHAVETATIGPASTYLISHRVHSPGTQQFRVRIDGTPLNWGSASAPMSIAVSAPKA